MSVLINASTSSGLIQSADTSGEIELQSNGTTALKVNTNEGIQILNCLGVGNATPSTSGAGITFPATQSASSDANTLDDYEEGTFTPVVSASGGATWVYNTDYKFIDSNTGSASIRYTKTGNIVSLNFCLQMLTTKTARINITLPFTISGDQQSVGGAFGGYFFTGTLYGLFFLGVTSNSINLADYGSAGTHTTLTTQNGTQCYVTFQYRAA
jgi:hypothetical protein